MQTNHSEIKFCLSILGAILHYTIYTSHRHYEAISLGPCGYPGL